MSRLSDARCLNHADREAAARCPACGRFFCRECVTEHEGRLLCAACLRTQSRDADLRERLGWVIPWGRALLGAALVWTVLLLIGWGLLSLPSEYQDAPASQGAPP